MTMAGERAATVAETRLDALLLEAWHAGRDSYDGLDRGTAERREYGLIMVRAIIACAAVSTDLEETSARLAALECPDCGEPRSFAAPCRACGDASIRYVVPGPPVTWQRSGIYMGRRITPRGQQEAKDAHRRAWLAAIGRRAWPLDGAFSVSVAGYYRHGTVGDVDRLASLALDALEGCAYTADRQVRVLTARVTADGTPERVEVAVCRTAETVARAKRISARARRQT